MNGNFLTMNKIVYIICCLFILSCGTNASKFSKGNTPSKNSFNIQSNVYEINNDSLLVKTFISFPISNLVFVKKESEFQASFEIMIRVEDSESGLQIKRISDNGSIVRQYYEDTRSNDNYQLSYDFILGKGKYNLIGNVKDLDSFNNWNNIEVINNNQASRIISPYYYQNQSKVYLDDEPLHDIDSLWFELPEYNFNNFDYSYFILQKEDTLKVNSINNCKSGELLLECPIIISDDMSGDMKIYIQSNSKNIFTSSVSIYDESSLWSKDINSILGVMSYILSYSEIKELYGLSAQDERIFIVNYLDSKDPDRSTNKNEFLEIIKFRYRYVNDNFSRYSSGLTTDRGQIYIVYGPPESIESLVSSSGSRMTASANDMFNIEKWYYSDKVFIFSDERTFGEMQLVKQF